MKNAIFDTSCNESISQLSLSIPIYFILSGNIMENISVIKAVSFYSEMIRYHFL